MSRPAGEETTVVQAVHGHWQERFRKAVIAAPLPDGGCVYMVRKRLDAPEGGRLGPVALIHGFAQNRYTWHARRRSFANYLAFHGFDVFNLDLRGHGRTRAGQAQPPDSFDTYATQDVPACLEAIHQLTGFPRSMLVGHSLGAAVSFAAAATAPHRAGAIVDIAGVYRLGGGRALMRTILGVARGLAPVVPHSLDRKYLPTHWVGPILAANVRLWNQAANALPYWPWRRNAFDADQVFHHMKQGWDPVTIGVVRSLIRFVHTGRICSADGRRDYAAEFCKLDIPLLVLCAATDYLAPPETVKPVMRESASRDKTYRLFGRQSDGVDFGHLDLITGKHAPAVVWPPIAQWMVKRADHLRR